MSICFKKKSCFKKETMSKEGGKGQNFPFKKKRKGRCQPLGTWGEREQQDVETVADTDKGRPRGTSTRSNDEKKSRDMYSSRLASVGEKRERAR